MREDTNDLQSDDAAMDNSEIESSGIIEESNEIQNIHPVMSSEEFEAKLTDFFTKHKKTKLKFVSQIAFEFKGQEAFVLEHLHNKYVLGLAAQKPQKKAVLKSEGHDEQPKVNIEPEVVGKPKSKKKLIIIVIIVVLLSGLGVTGFMMKDKLMAMIGMGHEAKPVETVKPPEKSPVVAAPPKAEVAPVEEVAPIENDSALEEVIDVLSTQ